MTLATEIAVPVRPDVLLVATRDPRGRMSGRKMVLRTIVESLTAIGCNLTVAHFGKAEGPAAQGAVHFVALPSASAPARLARCGLAFALGHRSLNEALYHSPAARRVVAKVIAERGIGVVVTDMIRTAEYGAGSGLPWVADLDDLLSDRYARMAGSASSAANLLGYSDTAVLRGVAGILDRFQPMVLRREAGILRRREVAVARAADVPSLVSQQEAARLTAATGVPVAATPMSVAEPAHPPSPAPRQDRMVFLGGLDYGPNLKSVLRFDREVLPALKAGGITDVRLDVIGSAAARERSLLSDSIHCRGYVEDLDAALQGYRAMLVPEVEPGGVKTKIIVAAMNRTLVLAHVTALDGMGLEPGKNVLSWTDPGDLAPLIGAMRRGDFDIAAMTESALSWARQSYGEAVLREKWARNISLALAGHTTRARTRQT